MTVLGASIPHDSAREHVAGEADYIDDLVPRCNELLVDFVGSPIAHGRIKHIDFSAALAIEGITAAYTHADVPGENSFGPVFHDEELLARTECHYIGQPIVVLAGTTKAALAAAKKLVRIEMEPLLAVFTINEAIAKQQFIGPLRAIQCGDVATAFANAEHQLEGIFESGGQEHFYLEPQSALAIPGEGGEITVYSSTQNPTEIQALVARCLGLRQNQVICLCRRMGGCFGGKETQAAQLAVLASLVALRTRQPARLVLSCDQDMIVTGKRHPYQARYRVSFTADGCITGLKIDFFSNGGFSADLSLAVMERSLLHAENAYLIPNADFTGRVCRTNLPSNTAFRGFGGPQAVATMENIIEEIAIYLGVDAFDVRLRNCYGVGERNLTPYGQLVEHTTLPRVMNCLAETSCYKERLADVQLFNSGKSRAQRMGISFVPVKFGISFTRKNLYQANALVNIQRVDLGERGFFATPDIEFNWDTGKGTPFRYYTNGAAVAEVLIDCFNGDVKVERVDLLMDLERSINPAIDWGQMTGGFVQGMGWVTTEELRYSESGELLSYSPTTYKVPNITDVPMVFNVHFLDKVENPLNIHGSKAVDEPPLLLGVSVWTAVKHALSFVSGGQVPKLNLPATNEEVLRRLAEYEQKASGEARKTRADRSARSSPVLAPRRS